MTVNEIRPLGPPEKVALWWNEVECDECIHSHPKGWTEAECNICNKPITNGQINNGEAIINSIGEMWHKACEE